MNKFSKEELNGQAQKFMAANNVDTFVATEDGNFFHPNDIGLARDHNNKNVKGEILEFSKEDKKSKKDDADLKTEDQKIEAIKNAAKEMADLGTTDIKAVKKELKKRFDKALVDKVLNAVDTH